MKERNHDHPRRRRPSTILLAVGLPCALLFVVCLFTPVQAHPAPAPDFQRGTLPALPSEARPVPPQGPAADYDEQFGITFTQNFTTVSYNVTAVANRTPADSGPPPSSMG